MWTGHKGAKVRAVAQPRRCEGRGKPAPGSGGNRGATPQGGMRQRNLMHATARVKSGGGEKKKINWRRKLPMSSILMCGRVWGKNRKQKIEFQFSNLTN